MEPALQDLRTRLARLEAENERLRWSDSLLREREAQLVEQAKLTALATLTVGLAHDVSSPNAVIANGLALLRQGIAELADGRARTVIGLDRRQAVTELLAQAQRMQDACRHVTEVIDGLRDFTRDSERGGWAQVDPALIVERAVSLTQDLLRRSTDHGTVDCPAGLPHLVCRQAKLVRVLVNLIVNACQALPDRSHAIAIAATADDRRLVFSVRDQGRGIPADLLSRVTEPFFTTRQDQGGTGLGLSVCHGIIREHGGELDIASTPGSGTCVRVLLPLRTPS
jgi:polar amino acid transport system substrate-binding protein